MGQTLSEPVVEKVRFVPLFFFCARPRSSVGAFYFVFWLLKLVLGPGARGASLSHEPLTQRRRNTKPSLQPRLYRQP